MTAANLAMRLAARQALIGPDAASICILRLFQPDRSASVRLVYRWRVNAHGKRTATGNRR